jgi:lipopolysaccharide transport system ATP-binding protein
MGALIALGAGFNPVLTGRENIYVNGSMLGLDRKAIDGKIDEIIDFADIGNFIDSPVQSYSSGMSVRLGFATAAVMIQPDVLLLDEVLAVGDLGFRYKCFARVGQLVKNAAVIFVSHDMPSVSRMATKVILMSDGQIEKAGGDSPSVIQAYNSKFSGGNSFVQETGEASITQIQVTSETSPSILGQIDYGETAKIQFLVDWNEYDPDANLTINILDKGDTAVAQMEARNSDFKLCWQGSQQLVSLKIPSFPLAPGEYRLWIILSSPSKKKSIAIHYGVSPFIVKGNFIGYIPFQPVPEWASRAA